MQKLTIRYLFVATAIIATSIAVLQSPYPPVDAIAYDASLDSPPERPEQPFTLQHFLALWPVRFLAYVGSITLSLHTIAISIGLNSVAKWTIVFSVPIVMDAFWKWYSVNRLGYHPGSLNVWSHVQIGLLINSASCISLAAILAIPQLRIDRMSTKQNKFR